RLVTEVERLARGLAGRGLRKGDRVALHMGNLPELIIAYHACFRVGAIAAPLNVRFKTAELRPLLQRLRPVLYIGQASLYSQIASIDSSILGSNSRFVVDGPVNDPRVQPWTRLFAETKGQPMRPAPDLDAPAVLLTTSGTTGQPKFVIHTLATLSKTAESFKHWGLDRNQITALFCPMVHGSGLFTMLACIRFGVPFVLLERFEPDPILDAIERHRCTWIVGLPFMFGALLQCQQARARNVDSLRICLAGGDVCPPHLQDQFPSFFGIPLRSFWVSTEACGSLTYGLQPGPVSRIVPGAQIRLVGDNHVPVARGEVGELVVRGPHVTLGYWAGPGQIKDAPKEGWFHTGDLMRQDEKGDLWFVTRKKHLIIRGGSNISPVEVERVLMAHPAVDDAAVVGVPDPDLGQRVAGFVQLADSAQSIDLTEILAFARERLADYKVPETLKIVDKIPRNTLGKIDRQLLLALLRMDHLKGGGEDRVGELVGGCFPLAAPLQGGSGNRPTDHRGL
ncbi:MAG: acyl--CoA ligase, partial [Verrucomicrobia bacterium]|nr:acyl--CoA ligase [Verrucomicrobiota bacterium]